MSATSTPVLALRLQDALQNHGGTITRSDLPGYLADLFGVDARHMLAVLFEEADAGRVEIAYEPPAAGGPLLEMTVSRALAQHAEVAS